MQILRRFSRYLVYLFISGCVLASLALAFPQDPANGGIPRSNRGSFQLQNAKLSTARGFGKRDRGMVDNFSPSWGQFDDSASRNIGVKTNFPSSLLMEEIQNKPDVMRVLLEKLSDQNGDGELTQEDQRRNTF